MTIKKSILFLLLMGIATFFMASVTSAAVDNVRSVLWQGDTGKYHTAMSVDDSGGDPLDAWSETTDNVLQVVYSGTTYNSWIRAVVSEGGSSTTYCVHDYGGGDCTEENLCTAGYDSGSFNESVTIPAGPRPDLISFEIVDTCTSGEYEAFLNGTSLGVMPGNAGGNCDCNPGVDTAIPGESRSDQTLLKGVITTTDNSSVWYKWVFGDGSESSVQELSGAKKYNVEALHGYAGAVGTPFTAMLMVDDVDDSMTNAVSDIYLVKIEEDNLDSRVNIAIDNGLWYLYKKTTFSDGTTSPYLTFNSQPVAVWSYGSHYASPTASAIQAFMINNHKETGNASEDPYVEPVALGLNWLFNGYYSNGSSPMLQAVDISVQHDDDPDANANGKGIEVRDNGYTPIYQGGMIMDAIIATGTPAASTGRDFDGNGTPDTYSQVLQDMVDMYAFGQHDTDYGGGIEGGWRYSWHSRGDNSACQWAAIGMIPAQQAPWNSIVGEWVKTYNNNWLNYSFKDNVGGNTDHGGFGYTTSGSGDALTPSGMVQLAFVGATTADTRWIKTERWLADTWSTWINSGNMYAYYAATKAMRLAQVDVFSSNSFNWYRGDGATDGIAGQLVKTQQSDGKWNGQWTSESLPTAWAVIILKPALFKAAPYACFTAHPNPNYADQPVMFDPACSGHTETGKDIGNLLLFEWDWDNDGTYDQSTTDPSEVTQSFGCASLPCTYPVTLRVTDDDPEELKATYTLDIVISNPPHPPVANAGGPYVVSLCAGDTLILDGSASFDPNDGEHENGCGSCPDDGITAWNWDFYGAPFDYTDGSGETVVADYTVAGTYDIGIRVTDNTSLAYPNSGSNDLTDENFSTATVYEGCACEIIAETGCNSVVLNWTEDGTYELLRSETGANSGFAKIADVTGTTYTDETVVSDTMYYYRLKGDDCMSSPAVITYVYDPALCSSLEECIDDLTAKAKTRKVRLSWACHDDADSYNVYRSKNPNVELTSENQIKNGRTSCAYTDRRLKNGKRLKNGTTYFYKITKVIGGQEVCLSNEVKGKPTARERGRRR